MHPVERPARAGPGARPAPTVLGSAPSGEGSSDTIAGVARWRAGARRGALQQRGHRAAAAHAKGTTVDDRHWRRTRSREPGQPAGTVAFPAPGRDRRTSTPRLVRFLETMPAAFCLLGRDWRFRWRQRRRPSAAGPLACTRWSATSLWEAFPDLTGSVVESTYRAAVASGRAGDLRGARTGAQPSGWFEVRAWPGAGRAGGLRARRHRPAAGRGRRAPGRRAGTRLLGRGRAPSSPAPLDTESALGRLAQLVVPTPDRRRASSPWSTGRATPATSAPGTPTRPAGRCWSTTPGCAWTRCRRTSPVARALRGRHPGHRARSTPVLGAHGARPRPRAARRSCGPTSPSCCRCTARGPHRRRPHAVPGRRPDRRRGGPGRPPAQVAAQAGRAIARVHRQSQQAELAEALQRSLLTDPPASRATPPSSCATCPAAEAARVGGDWYDAFLAARRRARSW